MEDTGYPSHSDQVRLLPNVCEAFRVLQRRGYAIVIISNQSGVGRGVITMNQAHAIHRRLEECLVAGGVQLDGAYYSFDPPGAATEFRKPGIGILLNAQRELALSFSRSFMIGDKTSDVEAGTRAGCQTNLYHAEGGTALSGIPEADFTASSWDDIVRIILKDDAEREVLQN